jgi:hypothetical protein
LLGVPVPSNGAFYTAQRGIAQETIELARLSVQRHCAFMSQGTAIAFDGAWAHARPQSADCGMFHNAGRQSKDNRLRVPRLVQRGRKGTR